MSLTLRKMLHDLEAERDSLLVMLREQYDLAHNVADAQGREKEGEMDEDGCDDRCRRAREALAKHDGGAR